MGAFLADSGEKSALDRRRDFFRIKRAEKRRNSAEITASGAEECPDVMRVTFPVPTVPFVSISAAAFAPETEKSPIFANFFSRILRCLLFSDFASRFAKSQAYQVAEIMTKSCTFSFLLLCLCP